MAVCFKSGRGGHTWISAKVRGGGGGGCWEPSSKRRWLSDRAVLPDQQHLIWGTGLGRGISCCDTGFYL